jgi:hypothetical protein
MISLREQVQELTPQLPDPGSIVLRAKLAGGTSWLLWFITAASCVVIAWQTSQIVVRQRSIDARFGRLVDMVQVIPSSNQRASDYIRTPGE